MWKNEVEIGCAFRKRKKESIEKSMCQALWGDPDVVWEMQPANNTAGGILCLWSEKIFRLERKVVGNGFILLTGQWVKEAQQVHIVSIYSPCDSQNKRILWEAIRQMKTANQGGLWCISGDFNNIRDQSERIGVCQRGVGESSIKEFDIVIKDKKGSENVVANHLFRLKNEEVTKEELEISGEFPDESIL